MRLTDDVLSLPGNLSQRANIANFISWINVLLPRDQQLYRILNRIRLQLANRNPRAWYFLIQCSWIGRANFGEASLSVTSTIICA